MNETERRKREWLSEQSEFHSLTFRTVNHRPEISRATFFGTFLFPQKKGAPSERLKKDIFLNLWTIHGLSKRKMDSRLRGNDVHEQEFLVPL
jgi:hypothetical protein